MTPELTDLLLIRKAKKRIHEEELHTLRGIEHTLKVCIPTPKEKNALLTGRLHTQVDEIQKLIYSTHLHTVSE